MKGIMTQDESGKIIDFVMFVIYRLAESWKKTPAEVYAVLDSAEALSEYLIPHFDVLHTLGADYLVEDLTLFVKNHGGEL